LVQLLLLLVVPLLLVRCLAHVLLVAVVAALPVWMPVVLVVLLKPNLKMKAHCDLAVSGGTLGALQLSAEPLYC
jgi:hypothetical protein